MFGRRIWSGVFLLCVLSVAHGNRLARLKRKIEANLPFFLSKGFEKANNYLAQENTVVSRTSKTSALNWKLGQVRRTSSKSKVNSACNWLGILETAKIIKRRYNIEKDLLKDLYPAISIPSSAIPSMKDVSICSSKVRQASRTCDSTYPYRMIDGSCNNLETGRGASGLPFKRYDYPAYEDGLDAIRGEGRTTRILPNPRRLSAALQRVSTISAASQGITQLLVDWGQFIDHDLTLTAETRAMPSEDSEPMDLPCCEEGQFSTPTTQDCVPIDVTQDSFYQQNGVQCLRFIRSLPSSAHGGAGASLGHREQINELTSFLDGSMVYGSTKEVASELRAFVGGRMKENSDAENICTASSRCLRFLPEAEPSSATRFFNAGDERVNEQPALTSLHNIFIRLHNFIADKFASSKPPKSDEIIYQETRRIIYALIQSITFNEFVSVVVGSDAMDNFDLRTGVLSYNPSIDPSISNVFATAAFRFGHTLKAERLLGDNVISPLVQGFFNTSFMKNTTTLFPSKILKGETRLPAEGMDGKLVNTLTNLLFASGPTFTHGSDLMSLNIMRGREHGIPSYNAWRYKCGLEPFTRFSQMYYYFPRDVVDIFRTHYSHVDDIDLFPAGIAETSAPNALLGPTFICLLGEQFKDIKNADRFWFEYLRQPKPFTRAQRQAIYATGLAIVLCQVTDIENIQPYPMLSSAIYWNRPVSCSSIRNEGIFNNFQTLWNI